TASNTALMIPPLAGNRSELHLRAKLQMPRTEHVARRAEPKRRIVCIKRVSARQVHGRSLIGNSRRVRCLRTKIPYRTALGTPSPLRQLLAGIFAALALFLAC